MVEQIIAADHYELIKILGVIIDPAEFVYDSGFTHFKIKEIEKGHFQLKRDFIVYHDEWKFAFAAASEGLFYGFVRRDQGETTLGIRAPRMMTEYIWQNGKWEIREIEDFDVRQQSAAMERFEIGQDLRDLKKALS